MASHVIAYQLLELLFGMHTFHFNCFFEDFNCVFTQIRCLSRVLLSLRTTTSFWKRKDFAGLGMWSVLVVQSEQHVIYRLMAGGGQGGPSLHGRNWRRETAMSGSSQQLTLKKGAPGDQVWDLLCVQLASYLERGPLMWMMPLHLHVNQKSVYNMMMMSQICTIYIEVLTWVLMFYRIY